MNELRIGEEDQAVTFEVRVAPRSSRNRVLGVQQGALRVALTSPPVDGAANETLRKLLAKALHVAKTDVEIVRGERSRVKLVRVYGLRPSDVGFDAS